MKLIFHPEADAEFLDAQRYYAAASPELGLRFYDEMSGVDIALADKLLESSGKRESFASQIEGLERQGYLEREGTAFTTHLAYEAGKLKVNGHPFPPTAPP